MKVLTLALLAASLIVMPALASPTTDAEKVASHVRKLELKNKFHLRQRIGGPFHLGHAYCGGTDFAWPNCQYEATGLRADAGGLVTSCTIGVRVHGKRWKRRVMVCAKGYPQH